MTNTFYIMLAYFAIGVPWCMWREAGWLIMVTDSRNVGKATFMALPGLVLMWLLWPICNTVTFCWFILAQIVGVKLHDREMRDR